LRLRLRFGHTITLSVYGGNKPAVGQRVLNRFGDSQFRRGNRSLAVAARLQAPLVFSHLPNRDREGAVAGNGLPQIG
jgi:hypothetical protein